MPRTAAQKDTDTGRFQGVFERLPYSLGALIEGLLWRVAPLVLQVLATLVVVAAVMPFKYAMLMLAVIVVHAIISYQTSAQYEHQAMHSNIAAGELSGKLSDLLRNAQRAVFNGASDQEIDRIFAASTNKLNVAVHMALLLLKAAAVQFGIIGIGIASLLALSAYDVVAEVITVGDFVMLQAYIFSFATPIASYGFVLRQAGVASVNVQEALDYSKSEDDPAKSLMMLSGSAVPAPINALDVRYSYQDRSALNGVTLSIPAGSFVVVAGPNGSGKSTLARIMAGLISPTSGKIDVGGQRPDRTGDGPTNILYVPQHVSLFNRSVLENGTYPPAAITPEQLRQALAELSFHEDASDIDLDFEVGEQGSRLSGGQVQKLELARVSHIQMPAIILDETTAALDVGSERAAIDLLRRSRKGMSTLVLISHRIYAAETADMVVFMQAGVVKAQGEHSALMRDNAAYQHFWAQQQEEDHEAG